MDPKNLRIKIGLFVFFALGLLVFFLLFSYIKTPQKTFYVTVDFDFVGNLTSGAPVKIAGMTVGKVDSISFKNGIYDKKLNRRIYARTILKINQSTRKLVTKNSQFVIAQGLLGNQFIAIENENLNLNKAELLPDDFPIKGISPPKTYMILSKAYTLLEETTEFLVTQKPAITQTLTVTSDMLQLLTKFFNENDDQLKLLLVNGNKTLEQTINSLETTNKILGNGNKIRRLMNNTNHLLSLLIQRLPALLDKTDQSLRTTNKLASMIKPQDKQRLLNSLNKLDKISDNVVKITDTSVSLLNKINSGQGTAGALVVKRDVYEDLKELIRDLRENPWKMFWKD